MKLGFTEHWKSTKLVLGGAHRQNVIVTKVEVDDVILSDSVTLRSEFLTLRQAYMEYYWIDSMTFSIGRQLHVWGQLEIFSPVDFLLPIDFNAAGFSFVKADNRMPQTTIKAAYYPIPNLEVSAYYFPFFEESDLFSSYSFDDYSDFIDGVSYFWTKVVPTGSDQDSKAVRAMWYGAGITAAFTYYDGFNNIPTFKQYYVEDETTNYADFALEYGYYPKKGIGFECSVPFDQMNVKFDMTISDAFTTVDSTNLDVANAMVLYNDGYADIPVYSAFYALGIDADFDTWFLNFYLMKIEYFKNPSMTDFWDAVASEYGDPDFPNIPFFPTLNIGRYFSEEKKVCMDWGLGILQGLWVQFFMRLMKLLKQCLGVCHMILLAHLQILRYWRKYWIVILRMMYICFWNQSCRLVYHIVYNVI